MTSVVNLFSADSIAALTPIKSSFNCSRFLILSASLKTTDLRTPFSSSFCRLSNSLLIISSRRPPIEPKSSSKA